MPDTKLRAMLAVATLNGALKRLHETALLPSADERELAAVANAAQDAHAAIVAHLFDSKVVTTLSPQRNSPSTA